MAIPPKASPAMRASGSVSSRTARLGRAGAIALALAGAALAFGAAAPAVAGPPAPARVVSMNVCTDQLAMLVAAPGQLVSISHLARDPRTSAMAEEAAAFPVNRGQAEEIFLLRPDLVLAGAYTTRAAAAMLKRLAIPVAEFQAADRLSDIGARLREMGEALGRREAAAEIAARFERDLAAIRSAAVSPWRPVAALYNANSYTVGGGTLADSIVSAAGLSNLAAALGYTGTVLLPLERLVMAAPDLVIRGGRYDAPALAQEVLTHPALAAAEARGPAAIVAGRDWVCGTPRVLGALRRLVEARNSLAGLQ